MKSAALVGRMVFLCFIAFFAVTMATLAVKEIGAAIKQTGNTVNSLLATGKTDR